ncbi:hypothetical protein DH2020_049377 [Rehmannia glutinosa]|uniref:Sulfotransferase n=1 Tax=Rehmannia glutinosa TaxID=99300 RepID=A0ABR0U330_REHGL
MLGYWNAHLKNPEEVLFLKYEDLKGDIAFYIKKIAEFLGCPFSEDEEKQGLIEQISKLCSFENLKNLEVNKTGYRRGVLKNSTFFRKGEVGDWANYLSPAMAESFQKVMESKLEGSEDDGEQVGGLWSPLDQFISSYHFLLDNKFEKDAVPLELDEAFDMFCEGIHSWGPFWDHILGYWNAHLKNPEKVLFLKYEDLKEDIAFHIEKIAEFMGYPFSEEELKQGLVDQIKKLCSLENLKNLEVNKCGYVQGIMKNSSFFGKEKLEIDELSNACHG